MKLKLLLAICLLCLTNNLFAKGEKKLFKAVQDGDLVKIEELLTKGANINSLDKKGFSPLRYAIKKNDINLVKALIEKGADVNLKYTSGEFPLTTAISSSDEKIDINIFKLLLEKGADVNKKDNDGNTALILASQQDNNLEVVKILIDKGADVNVKYDYTLTALDFAMDNNALEVAKLLLGKGATGKIFDEPAIIVYNVNINDYGYFNTTLKSYDMEGKLVDVSRPNGLQRVSSEEYTMKKFIDMLFVYELYYNGTYNYKWVDTKIIDSNNFLVAFKLRVIDLLKK